MGSRGLRGGVKDTGPWSLERVQYMVAVFIIVNITANHIHERETGFAGPSLDEESDFYAHCLLPLFPFLSMILDLLTFN